MSLVFLCYIAAAQEACDQAKSKLLEAEVRISSLETASKDVKRQETGKYDFLE